ncbi:MAG: ATP-dependent DNA ligase [Rickettsiales bacterium]|nr:ATP-dependent DNA ligase [Rickettsiales bacterium]|tara:strand:- start:362 stop:1681 length:1320 start_codon:yes stop_codon:yes gene_type:complete
MNNTQIIQKLESSSSRLFKEEVLLNEMKKGNVTFFEGLSLTYNRLLTFGVKKVPEAMEDGPGIEWSEFKQLANKLLKRELTGHAARDEIQNLMEKSKKDEWNFFLKRILQKDIRCGLSEKTINNVAKKNNFNNFLIPVFSCQLAQDCELHKKKLTGKKYLEVKLDGVRAVTIIYPSGIIDIFSRNGKELNNFDHLKDEIIKFLDVTTLKKTIVLDGEIVSKNFQELMKQIHRKNLSQTADASLFLFDILPLENFKKGIYESTLQKRIADLQKFYQNFFIKSEKIKLINSKLIDLETVQGREEFKKFNESSIIKGYEGIMIKDPMSFYECKRSTSWLKSKPFIEISLKVKNYEEGTGRNKGKLGAIIAEGNDNGKFFKLNIGSGFTDLQRQEFWNNKEKLIGQIVEVRADSISRSQDGDSWSLRFPRFKTFRGFDKNEKI